MENSTYLSRRERDVVHLILEGKSNKQIAVAMDISESTVEFHLTNLYSKLGVGSRAEAILRLTQPGKTPGNPPGILAAEAETSVRGDSGKSLVAASSDHSNNDFQVKRRMKPLHETNHGKHPWRKWVFWPAAAAVLLVSAAVLVMTLRTPKALAQYERECEYPDVSTVGQTIARSNASGLAVHGQFGAINAEPWSASPGSVTYKNINMPNIERAYLMVRYSKNSPSSAAILVYLDEEKDPRAAFTPKDQSDWNRFVWTESIFIGSVESGIHSIRFVTDGEKYGVADLDKFVLTAGPPMS
jgi:DNA-binding CsgD family transcriptional regulator